ncbi:MAG TPA: o-succinylbenzoate synthase [Bacteroidetes bacterium]|nr:o-succinylbenzoate synthase [Bacteroidota bacterium]
MLTGSFVKHRLHFKQPSGTSRGILTGKNSWYLVIYDSENPGIKGVGECSIITGLSIDDLPGFENKLKKVISDINNYSYWLNEGLTDFPAIRFGLETALKDIETGGRRLLFPSGFTENISGIPINGLVWMGSYDFMRKQIIEKINAGFRCIKLKIGAINFEDELKLLKLIRTDFNENELELRVDANGAFSPEEAPEKLKRLDKIGLHSIEQPIRAGQWEELAKLCETTPLPIALDEELIGISDKNKIIKMLETIRPQYIIVKPGLLGGFRESEIFIAEAEKRSIGWWVTSALEGNIGLNAIAQWAFTLDNPMPQGLGTGQVFSDNIPSPLYIRNAALWYDPEKKWNLSHIFHE